METIRIRYLCEDLPPVAAAPGGDWVDLNSGTNASYSATEAAQYRCAVSDSHGTTLYSNIAAVTVWPEQTITAQPEDASEGSLRPRLLNEYIGQEKAKENLRIFIQAARDITVDDLTDGVDLFRKTVGIFSVPVVGLDQTFVIADEPVS